MNPTLQQILEQHLGVFLLALFVALLVCFFAWKKKFFKLDEFNLSSIRVSLIQVLGLFFLYFAVSFLVPLILIQLMKTLPVAVKQQWSYETDAVRAWLNLINLTVLAGVFWFYLKKQSQETVHTVLGEGTFEGVFKNIQHFFKGSLTFLISFPFVLAISQLFSMVILIFQLDRKEQLAVRFLKSTMENPVLFAITTFFMVLVVPILEELLFRGFLQNWIAKTFKKRGWAIFLTALIFSLFHFSVSQGWGNLEIIPSLFVLALFLSFIYYKERSLWGSIGLHATFNGVNILLMSLSI